MTWSTTLRPPTSATSCLKAEIKLAHFQIEHVFSYFQFCDNRLSLRVLPRFRIWTHHVIGGVDLVSKDQKNLDSWTF